MTQPIKIERQNVLDYLFKNPFNHGMADARLPQLEALLRRDGPLTAVALGAARLGATRLIDNLEL